MSALAAGLIVVWGLVATAAEPGGALSISIPCNEAREVDLSEVVARLADATRIHVERPSRPLRLPVAGLGGPLTRRLLADCLGPDADISIEPRALVITLAPRLLAPDGRADWEARLRELAARAERETQRRQQYGMHALKSYRPNDPKRPTVCLVHGLNSSTAGFVHMIPQLEDAGYGIVTFDYAYNQKLDVSCAAFARDWKAFRREAAEKRPWAIVAHSMGTLVARSYVEAPEGYGNDVSKLILIAPVNQGSSLAKTQTLLQLLDSTRAVTGGATSDALANLADGLGDAAEDLTPGSNFLKTLNGRPRRAGVAYHILAGDSGFVSTEARKQIEGRLDDLRRDRGLLGGLARFAIGDLSGRLDEVSDGTGDGCVSVARTKLDGVTDHVVIHANHAELIRAPVLFRDPGPVACMPDVLRWLKEGEPSRPKP